MLTICNGVIYDTTTTKSGGDLVSAASKLANKLGIPLKNWHLPGHKFTGPFTELDKRIDENDNPLPGYEPFNQIDEIAMRHDICYRDADSDKTDEKTRKICDKKMLDNLNSIKTKGIREKIDYLIVKPIIWIKHKLGMGLDIRKLEAKELHAPIRKKFKRRRVFVYNIDDIWSADLKDMQSLSKSNKNYKYLLTVIDIFSKFAYATPLKSKSSEEVINAFKSLFATGRKPKKLWTDCGSEFTNNKFIDFLKKNNIELYHVFNEGKACVVERFNITLGEMIQKHLTSTNSKNYINILNKLIDDYNNRYHTSIKMTPYQASNSENKGKVIENLYPPEKRDTKKAFKVGDRVRIYRYKTHFEKGYMPNWTREIFTVSEINKTNPITYKIKDSNDEPILGSFYKQELLLTSC